MSLFSNLKISHRVLVLALAALAGILVISGIFIGQRQVEAGYQAVAKQLSAKQADVSRMKTHIHESLRWEQDFLLRKDIASAGQFEASV